jgi:hypothetical protein
MKTILYSVQVKLPSSTSWETREAFSGKADAKKAYTKIWLPGRLVRIVREETIRTTICEYDWRTKKAQ